MRTNDKALKAVAKLLEENKIKGILVATPSKENDAIFSLNGDEDELAANLAYLMYNYPSFLKVGELAVRIATNRLKGNDIDDSDRSKLN